MNLKEQYWKYSLIAIILVLGIILFLEFMPFLSGILGASTIYLMVRNQMKYLTEKKHLKNGLAAMLLLGEAILCFLIPLSLAAWLFLNKLQNINLDPNSYISSIQHLSDLIQEKTGYNMLDKSNLLSAVSILPKIGQVLVGSISSFSINILVLIFVLYFMLIGGKQMENYVYDILPFSDKNKKNVLNEINNIVRSNAIGIPLLAVIQGIIAMLGYFIFRTPDPLLFGFLTCFATIIPIIGTALIWFPLAVYMALSGNWINAIGLSAYAILVVSNIDNLIRFVLQKKMADTHPLVTIFGVVIGLSLFGFMGVIFGPLLLSIFILCINIFKKEYLEGGNQS